MVATQEGRRKMLETRKEAGCLFEEQIFHECLDLLTAGVLEVVGKAS